MFILRLHLPQEQTHLIRVDGSRRKINSHHSNLQVSTHGKLEVCGKYFHSGTSFQVATKSSNDITPRTPITHLEQPPNIYQPRNNYCKFLSLVIERCFIMSSSRSANFPTMGSTYSGCTSLALAVPGDSCGVPPPH